MTEEMKLDPEALFGEDHVEPIDVGQQESPEADGEEAETPEESPAIVNEAEEAGAVVEDAEIDETKAPATENVDGKEDAQGDAFEVNGKEYTTETLTDYIVELENGSLRQSDYTKKTQEVSGERKALESNMALMSAIKSADLMDSVVDALKESGNKDAEALVQAVVDGVEVAHPDTQALTELQGKLDSIESEKSAEIQLSADITDLVTLKGLTKADGESIIEFAEKYFTEKGVALPLESAFDLWQVDSGKTIVKRKQPSIPKTPSAKSGVKPPDNGEWDTWEASKLFH